MAIAFPEVQDFLATGFAQEQMQETEDGDEGMCIFCACNPDLSFCGKYVTTPFEEGVDWDPSMAACPDCLDVIAQRGDCCPYCGREDGDE